MRCINVLKPIYKDFMKIHTVLAAHSVEFPYIDENIFKVFIHSSKLVDNTFKAPHAV